MSGHQHMPPEPCEASTKPPPKPSDDRRSVVPFTDYPFPCSNGRVALLYLPVRMEQEDADRLAEFVKALVLDA